MIADLFDLKSLPHDVLEERARENIRAFRRTLAEAQDLHEKLDKASPKERNAMRRLYEAAARRHDMQHMIVCMSLELLGYIPKIKDRNI